MKTWTVVVTCYNYAHYLSQCVDSIARNDCDKTIVIVNDCSPDDTEEVALRLKEKHDCVEYIRNDTNIGLSAGRNRAISMYPSKYVCCFDADDWMSDTYLPLCEKVLATYDVATSDQEIVDESKAGDFCLTIKGMNGETKLIGPESVTVNKLKNGIGGQPRGRLTTELDLRNRYACLPASSSFKYDDWKFVGGFDEHEIMKLGWEDWEFFIRLAKAGKTFGKVQGDHIYHRVHSKHKMHFSAEQLQVSYQEFADVYQQKIWEYVYAKHNDLWNRKMLL